MIVIKNEWKCFKQITYYMYHKKLHFRFQQALSQKLSYNY